MRTSLIDASVTTLIEKGIIEKSEAELYYFGMNQLFLFLVNVATTVAIGAICGMLLQSVLFSLAYIPLRRYAGGYHANTPRRCYCLSVLLVACVLMILRYIPFSGTGMISILVISFVLIFIKAPVESNNKPLNEAEKRQYQLKAQIVLLIETSLALCLSLAFLEVSMCIVIAICCSAFMLLIGSRR